MTGRKRGEEEREEEIDEEEKRELDARDPFRINSANLTSTASVTPGTGESVNTLTPKTSDKQSAFGATTPGFEKAAPIPAEEEDLRFRIGSQKPQRKQFGRRSFRAEEEVEEEVREVSQWRESRECLRRCNSDFLILGMKPRWQTPSRAE